MPAKPPVIVDASAFFAGTRKLYTIVEKRDRLSTIDLIVFEFTKVMEEWKKLRGSLLVIR